MKVRWGNMEMIIMQAGGLLLTRRSGTLRRAGGDKTLEKCMVTGKPSVQRVGFARAY